MFKEEISVFKKTIFIIFILIFSSFFSPTTFSQTTDLEIDDPASLKWQARWNRQQGLKAQQAGLYDEAIAFYKKALALDPSYIEPYNDLGVVYENKGMLDKAEQYYLKALDLDPYYLPAYSNLASLYEQRGDLKKAAEYWRKRVKLGSSDDPWTIKATEHLKNIALVVEEVAQQLQEEETLSLIEEIKNDFAKTSDAKYLAMQREAREYLKRAEINYRKNNYITALNEAAVAKHLDPSNTDIDAFIEEVSNKINAAYRQ